MRMITRRTVLKGLGTAVALPFLEAMMPTRAMGATTAAAAKAAMGPRRVAWVYVPTASRWNHGRRRRWARITRRPASLSRSRRSATGRWSSPA